MSTNEADTEVKVWDPLVRWGHWILAAAFFIAYLTEDEFEALHVWAGYVVGAVVAARIIWGFVGTKHARFSDFLYSPMAAARYLAALVGGGARRYLGHSPAGGVMVLLLLAALTATTWSGLMVHAYENNAGPLAGWVADSRGAGSVWTPLRAAADDDEHDDDRDDEHDDKRGESAENEAGEERWEEIHEVSANLTLLLVVLHIAGVALASIKHRENLVRPMFNGRKRT